MTAALATGSAAAAIRGMSSLRVLDLFSGIGAFSLGLERAGMRTVAFCEVDPFCRRVLAKHWPEVPQYDDVRTLTAERLHGDGIGVDVICGGFPCQDISVAGRGAGIDGARSGIWCEFARLIGEIRPRYAVMENVAALLHRGIGTVLRDLAESGYDAEWDCIPAAFVGAPHLRDRAWIVAYPKGVVRDGQSSSILGRCAEIGWPSIAARGFRGRATGRVGAPWVSESNLDRVVDGASDRVDRVRSLGNSLVPQIPELIGHAILAAETRAAA